MTDTETDAPDHTDLITALQAGPGNRELSDQVLVAFGWTYGIRPLDGAKYWWKPPVGDYPNDIPDPTQSIDDALALMPKGCKWTLDDENRCLVWPVRQPRSFGDSASTPALAICIAILKAKEAE